jgi:outer membrane protein assembly factor BamB
VGERVYVASEHGKLVELRAAGEWEVVAIHDFDADIYATPAVSEGRLYVRTRNELYAIGEMP